MNDLRAELARVGIRGPLARRIELEIADHLACDPAAQLGAPRLIAERFAAELRLPKTRRVAFQGFAALALTALALAVMPSHVGQTGVVVSLGGLAIVLGGQIALVAGVLAVWRVLRKPDERDLRLVQRRLAVALAGGAVVVVGHAVQTAALEPRLSTWWLLASLPALALPALALGGVTHGLRGAAALTVGVQPARRGFPLPVAVAIGSAAAVLVTVGSAFAEHSWDEGLTRGGLEAIAFASCFAALGRYVGVRR